MATQVQFRRGTSSQNDSFTGAAGEISINTSVDTIRVHDGSTQGGFELARNNLQNTKNVGVLTATVFRGNVNSSGVSTFANGNVLVGGATTALVVRGDARITGILTVGTSSITLDGSSTQVNVGSATTIHTGGFKIGSSDLHSTGLTASNLNVTNNTTVGGGLTVTGAIDANGGANISGGETILSSATISDLTSGRVVLAGTSGAIQDSANLTFNGSTLNVTGGITLSGDLTVNGTTTTINSTTLTVDDKNIELGATTSPSDTSADGGGITLKGSTDHTISWSNANDSWDFSEHVNIASGKEFKINNVSVLSATTLGSSVVNSSLTSVGTIASGTWQGTAIANNYLANSTISGVSLGSNLNTLTMNTSGTGLSGSTTYNGSGASTFTVTSNATSNNTNSTIVARDGSGNFSAGTITATLAGTATTTTNIPNLSGDITSANTVTTLATVNSNVGTFGNGSSIPTITVNAKGLVTAVSTTAVDPANDGTLTLATSGTGLSGSATFTANDSDNVTFTVTSNATSANTASTIVARDASGNFSAGTITASLSGNATSATALATARTIALSGDVTGSASFDGSANATISATIAADSVALGTDTTGNYVASITNGSYITGANGGSEGAGLTLAVDATSANTASKVVARDASGNFSAGTITATLSGNATSATSATSATTAGSCTGNAATATTLQTARTINGVSFNGSANITVEPYIEDDASTNATRYLIFTDDSTAGYKRLNEDADLYYNPSTNTLSTGNLNSTSDISLKKDIEVINDAHEILSQIRGVRFTWKETDKHSTGVIAQDVEKVLPELVGCSDKGIKSVNYQGLIGVLIEAVKDQQKQIDALKEEINSLKS